MMKDIFLKTRCRLISPEKIAAFPAKESPLL